MRTFIANYAEMPAMLGASTALFCTRRSLAVLLAIAFLAGLTGPFGTATSFEIWARFLYWTLIVFGTVLPVHLVLTMVERGAAKHELPAFVWVSLACVCAAVPATVVVCLVSLPFGSRFGVTAFVELFWQNALVILAVTTIVHLVSAASSGQPDAPGEVAIMKRLPGAIRGKLLRLTAQDHYVEVVTDRGRALVPMRLRDAIAEASPISGAQVHRSHWVAKGAVLGRCTIDRSVRLRLSDGGTVPIGRKFRDAAMRAGVLF